jgi:hydrogenase expression/formation protein HypC
MCLAVPAKIIKLTGNKKADVDFGGLVRSVQLDFLPDLKVGEYIIVHAGFALQRMARKDALETIKLLKEMEKLNGR